MARKAEPSRGLLFGLVAADYERYRMGYGGDVVDAVLAYAGRPVASALEVGAGTGKATRAFGARGIHVVALEPDAEMARLLEKATHGLAVTTTVTTFERFRTEARFDLVYAAAAWHWTDPLTRWQRAVGLLVPGGVLALLGRAAELNDPELAAAVAAIEKRLLPAEDTDDVHSWSAEEMAAADGFADVGQFDLPGVATTSRDDFVGRLSTVSAYLALDPQTCAEALRQVRTALPDEFEIDTTVQLCLARRV